MADELMITPQGPPLGGILKAWDQELDALDRSINTRIAYKRALAFFAGWLEDHGLTFSEVTRGDVSQWRDNERATLSGATVKLELAAVRNFYDFLGDHDLVERNPAARVRVTGATGPAHPRQELTSAEVRALLACCTDDDFGARDHAMLTLMVYCGVRTVEIHRANTEDVQTYHGRVILMVWGKGRGGPNEYVILPAPAEDAIRHWLAIHPRPGGPLFVSMSPFNYGGRLTESFIRKQVKHLYRRIGINDPTKTTHSLRHTAISAAIRAGANPLQVRSMARHGRIDTTLGYFHERGRFDHPVEDSISYDEE